MKVASVTTAVNSLAYHEGTVKFREGGDENVTWDSVLALAVHHLPEDHERA